jgi:hypothetical protein
VVKSQILCRIRLAGLTFSGNWFFDVEKMWWV